MTNGEVFPQRGEIYWVTLDPTVGNEIKKRRPGLIISNDMSNEHTNIVIVAPITSNYTRVYKVEVRSKIAGKEAKILLQQCRAIDKLRLGPKIGKIDKEVMLEVEKALRIVFDL